MKSTRVLLAKRPVGEPDDSCFEFAERDVPALNDGQILIKCCGSRSIPTCAPYERRQVVCRAAKIGDVMTANRQVSSSNRNPQVQSRRLRYGLHGLADLLRC